jgi:hypothetical protein
MILTISQEEWLIEDYRSTYDDVDISRAVMMTVQEPLY